MTNSTYDFSTRINFKHNILFLPILFLRWQVFAQTQPKKQFTKNRIANLYRYSLFQKQSIPKATKPKSSPAVLLKSLTTAAPVCVLLFG
jgi:hypothetical protein